MRSCLSRIGIFFGVIIVLGAIFALLFWLDRAMFSSMATQNLPAQVPMKAANPSP